MTNKIPVRNDTIMIRILKLLGFDPEEMNIERVSISYDWTTEHPMTIDLTILDFTDPDLLVNDEKVQFKREMKSYELKLIEDNT